MAVSKCKCRFLPGLVIESDIHTDLKVIPTGAETAKLQRSNPDPLLVQTPNTARADYGLDPILITTQNGRISGTRCGYVDFLTNRVVSNATLEIDRIALTIGTVYRIYNAVSSQDTKPFLAHIDIEIGTQWARQRGTLNDANVVRVDDYSKVPILCFVPTSGREIQHVTKNKYHSSPSADLTVQVSFRGFCDGK